MYGINNITGIKTMYKSQLQRKRPKANEFSETNFWFNIIIYYLYEIYEQHDS